MRLGSGPYPAVGRQGRAVICAQLRARRKLDRLPKSSCGNACLLPLLSSNSASGERVHDLIGEMAFSAHRCILLGPHARLSLWLDRIPVKRSQRARGTAVGSPKARCAGVCRAGTQGRDREARAPARAAAHVRGGAARRGRGHRGHPASALTRGADDDDPVPGPHRAGTCCHGDARQGSGQPLSESSDSLTGVICRLDT